MTGAILYYRYSLDGGATWHDTDAAIQLDGSTNQAFWGSWQPIPPMLRQSIDTTVALFGRDGNGSTIAELVDWFVLDIRGVDHTSAARLLPPQVTPAEIADPTGIELLLHEPGSPLAKSRLAGSSQIIPRTLSVARGPSRKRTKQCSLTAR